jgi:uridine kinase
MQKTVTLKQGVTFLKKWIKEQDDSRVHVIAIAGGTASGKGYVVEELLKLPKVHTLQVDRYYYPLKPGQKQATFNHDEPKSLEIPLLIQNIKQLKKRKTVEVPIYRFADGKRTGKEPLTPTKILIIDGLFSFYNKGLQAIAELTVYIHADDDIRKQRRIARDKKTRGISPAVTRKKWDLTVQPMHEKWVHPQKKVADLIITNNKKF